VQQFGEVKEELEVKEEEALTEAAVVVVAQEV
jgi:hypothetical protein